MTHKTELFNQGGAKWLALSGPNCPYLLCILFPCKGAGSSTFALARFHHHHFMEKKGGKGLVFLGKQLDLLPLARQITEPARHGALCFRVALELSLHGLFDC